MKLLTCLAGLLLAGSGVAAGAPLLSEGFEDVAALPGRGWLLLNQSAPPGSTGWFQGQPAVFAAAGGPADAYIAANFNNAAYGGSVSNWLLTPQLSLVNGSTLDFSLRLLGEGALDRLEVYLDSGAGPALLGAYEAMADTGWQQHSLLLSGLSGPDSGRFAFRYVVDDTSAQGDYIGLDSISIHALPEPGTVALVGLGMLALARPSRRRWWPAGLYAAALAAQAAEPGVMRFPHVQVVAQPAVPAAGPQGALMAYKDPQSGRLTGPEAAQAAQLAAAGRSGPPPAPPLGRPAHGGVSAMLDERHARYAVARKDGGGHVATSCAPRPGVWP